MRWLDLWFVTWMMCVGTYAVGNDAEEEQVSTYFGEVAVIYPPPPTGA